MAPRRAAAPSDTRARLVEAARRLFWEKGYAATGLAEILDCARANSGSFYYFFESKDALLRVVLDSYAELLEPQIVRPAFEAAPDPIGRVLALVGSYRQRLVDTGCRYGCPIGRLALEIDPENAPAHALIARNFAGWKSTVEASLRAAGLREPAQAAALTLAVMEGAVMQARAHRSVKPFDACLAQLREYLQTVARRGPTRRRNR